MTVYIKSGNKIRISADGALDLRRNLPPANYVIQYNEMASEYYLEETSPFVLPLKMYGDIDITADRIINTYTDRTVSTGVLLSGDKGSGKALRVDQLVYSPTGEHPIGTTQVGDEIYGDDGHITKVVGVYPQGIRDMFKVTFNDGSEVIADGEHLWSVKQTTPSKAGFLKHTSKLVDGKRKSITKNKTLTTNQIKEALEQQIKHVVPLCEPINFPISDVSIDRYLLGILLGDGCISYPSPTISSSDNQIIEYISSVLDEGYELFKIPDNKYDYRIKQTNPTNYGGVVGMSSNMYTDVLKQLGLFGKRSNDKFIPDQLKYDSIENRLSLLQGLMDSDGTITKNGSITFTTVSAQLAHDVIWLARSLGFRSSIQHVRKPSYTYNSIKKVGQLAYTIQMTGKHNDKVFRLTRKLERVKKCSSLTKTIVSIEQCEPDEAVCIKVDNESHLFLTNDFTVTHNTLLAKRISNKLLSADIATLVINESLYGEKFNQFIQSIDQPCVIIFDEFEKVYKREEQTHILTLLDGVFSTKKLFILTTNDPYRIDEHMQNRPGRLFYNINYVGLSVNFIRDYCEDSLNNKTYIDEICKLSSLFASFNFDILKALVEEMNRYGESPQDALKMLNAQPEDTRSNKFNVSIVVDGVQIPEYDIYNDSETTGNPLAPAGINTGYKNPKFDDDEQPYYIYVNVLPQHLTTVDYVAGVFVFVKDNVTVTLTRDKKQKYQYYAF